MTKKLTKASLIAGTLALLLGLTGCGAHIYVSDHDSDYMESTEEANEDAAEAAEEAAEDAAEAAEAAADAAENAADAAEELTDAAIESLEFVSDYVDDYASQLPNNSGLYTKDAEKEAVKLYDDEKRLAEGGYQLIAMHNPLSIDANKFYDKARLTGSFDAWEFEVSKGKTVEIPYTFAVSQGKVKVILISPDKKVTTLIEKVGGSKDKPQKGTLKLNLKKGKSMIRIVGKNEAIYGLEMAPPEGDFPMYDSE